MVDYNVKKYRESGSYLKNKRSGRPNATTSANDRRIVVTSKLNRPKTAPEITAELDVGSPKPVSVSTVKHGLQKASMDALRWKSHYYANKTSKTDLNELVNTNTGPLMSGTTFNGRMSPNLNCSEPEDEYLSDLWVNVPEKSILLLP